MGLCFVSWYFFNGLRKSNISDPHTHTHTRHFNIPVLLHFIMRRPVEIKKKEKHEKPHIITEPLIKRRYGFLSVCAIDAVQGLTAGE